MEHIRFNGELADGLVHMTAREFCNHNTAEDYEKNKMLLRKIANNPILTDDTKRAIRFAMYRLDDITWLRKRNNDLQDMLDNMKR